MYINTISFVHRLLYLGDFFRNDEYANEQADQAEPNEEEKKKIEQAIVVKEILEVK